MGGLMVQRPLTHFDRELNQFQKGGRKIKVLCTALPADDATQRQSARIIYSLIAP